MGLFDVKCQCPSCFEEIYPGECKIMSGVTKQPLKEPKGPFARMVVERLDGPEYALEGAYRVCTECNYALPYDIERVPSIILAVVGDTHSGKSHYLASLVHQIKAEWMGHSNGLTRFIPLTPDVEEEYKREYFERLHARRQTLNITPKQRVLAGTKYRARPLIYQLVRAEAPDHPATVLNLMIYDLAGEDFFDGKLKTFGRFVYNTNAFIFVADPFAIKPITKQLPEGLQNSLRSMIDVAQKSRIAERFNLILTEIERYRRLPHGSNLPGMSVAIMLSKSDLLRHVNTPPNIQGYRLMKVPRYSSVLDLWDIQAVGQEVESLLLNYQQDDLLVAARRFKQVQFFATSATGESQDTNNNFQKVVPHRCLDPLLWILYCLGVVKSSK